MIDHCLGIKAGPTLESSVEAMRVLAELPNVHAKLSFIPAGSAEEYPCRTLSEEGVRRFYNETAEIIRSYEPNKSEGRTEDGWNWTVEISSKTLKAEASYKAHS